MTRKAYWNFSSVELILELHENQQPRKAHSVQWWSRVNLWQLCSNIYSKPFKIGWLNLADFNKSPTWSKHIKNVAKTWFFDFWFKCMRQAILDKKCYVIHVHIASVIKLLIQLYWTISFWKNTSRFNATTLCGYTYEYDTMLHAMNSCSLCLQYALLIFKV